MDERIDRNRRRFLGHAAMMMTASQLRMSGAAEAAEGVPRQLAALVRAKDWLNSPPPSATTLVGKVVLVQFGTYTCINWLRTLPYIRAWAHKYKDALSVIGVHTPEFTFEREIENVRLAMRQMRIDHPIVLDNDYAIWRAFDNRYWPALYLVDARGRVRYQHFGEGEYARSESAIQRYLADAGASGGSGTVSPTGSGVEAPADWGNLRSPETYLGYDRGNNFSSRSGPAPGRPRAYTSPARLALNQWGLDGEWTFANERSILNRPQGRLVCRFHARDVHLVMGPARRGTPIRFRVSIDGQPPGQANGVDVDASGGGTVVEQRLYQLLRQSGSIADRTVDIAFIDAGVEVFAFTFG